MKILLFQFQQAEQERKELIIATISDITISAGSTTGTASFTPTDDSTYEGNETGIVAISGVSGADAAEDGTQSVTITITEDDSAPTVTLATSASSIAENAGSSLTLTATLSIATTADVTVALSTSGTGTEGTDYRYNFRYYYFCRRLQLEQHHLHQQMIVCMKEMKRVLLHIFCIRRISYGGWNSISYNNYY